MNNKLIFTTNYNSSDKILTGKIELSSIEKEDAKSLYDLTIDGINHYPDYSDYILDSTNVEHVTIESVGYLMKIMSSVKKTAGYMILVSKEDVLQKFMISNPEMFDFYAVFFTIDDAVKYIKSKRQPLMNDDKYITISLEKLKENLIELENKDKLR